MGKFLEWQIIDEKISEGSNDIAGVWALFGNRKDISDNKWYCLQVGQTKSIKTEIKKNMQLMDRELNSSEEVKFVNQFGEKVFSYCHNPSTRELIYSKHIKEMFKNFKFVLIYKDIENNEGRRKSIEKEFAYRTKSVFWRNGKPFKEGADINYADRKGITYEIPDNGEVSKLIKAVLEEYNDQIYIG